MIKLLHGMGEVWPEIRALATKGRQNKVAVAFVSKGARNLLPLKRGDTIVIDMSIERVRSGATNPFAVEEYYKNGVSVFTRRGLHAKVFLLGSRVVVGSTNVSGAANSLLDEAVLITNERSILLAAEKFIDGLVNDSKSLPVTEPMLKKLQKQFLETKWHAGGSADEPPSDLSLGIMKEIAPKSVRVPKHGSPYMELTGGRGKAIHRIYLQDDGDTVVLKLHPADTMEQARPFYLGLNVQRFVSLKKRDRRWEAKPNFHLGYRTQGFWHKDTTNGLSPYLRFWTERPEDFPLKAVEKKHRATLKRSLKKCGMFQPSDVEGLEKTLGRRSPVSVRPGVTITFTWDARPTAKEVIARINEALATWGESVARLSKQGMLGIY